MRYHIKTRKYGTIHFWNPEESNEVYVSFSGEATRLDKKALAHGRTEYGAPLRVMVGTGYEFFVGLCNEWYKSFRRLNGQSKQVETRPKKVMQKFFKVSITCENDAFAEDAHAELARIFTEMADAMRAGCNEDRIYDVNGNTIGGYGFWYE